MIILDCLVFKAKLEGDMAEENELVILKKAAGRGWRNSVMERRIYGRWDPMRAWQDYLLKRLSKSAKREAEDWARQTKRTLGDRFPQQSDKQKSEQNIFWCRDLDCLTFSVMEMIKHRKHSWISRPRRQVRKYWYLVFKKNIDVNVLKIVTRQANLLILWVSVMKSTVASWRWNWTRGKI